MLVWLMCVHFFRFICILLFILLSVSLLCHDIVRWPYLATVAGCKTGDVQCFFFFNSCCHLHANSVPGECALGGEMYKSNIFVKCVCLV